MKKVIIIATWIAIGTIAADASVFSAQGLGIPESGYGLSSVGRAGLGLAAYDTISPNAGQPAAIAEMTDVRFTISGSAQSRGVKERGNHSAREEEFQFQGFELTMPLYKNFRMALIGMPETRVSAKTITVEEFDSTSYKLRRDANGGLSRYGFVFAYKTGNWRFGYETGYMSGVVNHGWQTYFTDANYGDGWFTTNQQYYGWYNRFGAIYTLGWLRQSIVVSPPVKLLYREQLRHAMTERFEQHDGQVTVPWDIRYGAAAKWKKWWVGGDYYWSQWSEMNTSTFLHDPIDQYGGGVWAERPGKPGYLLSFPEKMTLRTGLNYRKLPMLSANGKQIDEVSLGMGVGYPLRSMSNRIDLSFGYTWRGNIDQNRIQENILWGGLSVSAAEQWFYREKPVRRKTLK